MKFRVIPQMGGLLLLIDDFSSFALTLRDAVNLQAELALATREAAETVMTAHEALSRGIQTVTGRLAVSAPPLPPPTETEAWPKCKFVGCANYTENAKDYCSTQCELRATGKIASRPPQRRTRKRTSKR